MKYTLFFLAALTLFGCDSNASPSANNTGGQIVPLKIGNYWHYRLTLFDGLAEVVKGVQENYTRVVRDTIIAGERWYVLLKTFGTTPPDSGEVFATNRSDGYYELFVTTPQLKIPYPANSGEKFVRRYTTPAEFIDSIYVGSTDTSVTVPAGTFSTYHYRHVVSYGDTYYSDNYYVPGVGLAYFIGYPINSDNKASEGVLLDYKVN